MENQHNIDSLERSIEKLKSLINKNNKQKVDEQLENLVAHLQNPNGQQNQVVENDDDDDSIDFDFENCEAYKHINEKFNNNNSKIGHEFLTTIANEISKIADVKLKRNQKRKRSLLYKWFNDNWDKLKPVFDEVQIINDESQLNSVQ